MTFSQSRSRSGRYNTYMNYQTADRLHAATEEWEERLADSGYRRTGPRRTVVQAILEQPGPVTAQEIADRLRASGVGRATVFRTIDVLTDLGMLHRLHTGSCNAYTVCPREHHHHLTCSTCGRVESVAGCGLDEQLALLARGAGFSIEGHQLELTGRCAACQ